MQMTETRDLDWMLSIMLADDVIGTMVESSLPNRSVLEFLMQSEQNSFLRFGDNGFVAFLCRGNVADIHIGFRNKWRGCKAMKAVKKAINWVFSKHPEIAMIRAFILRRNRALVWFAGAVGFTFVNHETDHSVMMMTRKGLLCR